MKSLISLFALLSLTLIAVAQPPDTLWTRTFGGINDDWGYCVQQCADGGYIIAGNNASNGGGNEDLYLIKTDTLGNQIWQDTFGGNNIDSGHDVQQTTDGGHVIVGYTYSFGAGSGDVYLIKTDASGNLVWQRTFGGSNGDCGWRVLQTLEGGYIITGFTNSYGAGDADVYLIKTDATGNQIWQRTFGGSSGDYGLSIQLTSDGGYAIAGYTDSYGAGGKDVYLIKTDAEGNLVWQRTFGGSNDDFSFGLKQTSDGGYIIVGFTFSFGSGYNDVYLLKTDYNGNQTWQHTFGGSNWDYGYCVNKTPDGGYIIIGSTTSYGEGEDDVYLIKTDSAGDQIWGRTFGGSSVDWGWYLQQTTDGGYIISGYTESYGAGSGDVYLIKTDASGTPVKPWGEPPSPPAQFALLGAFPNPFNPSTTIRFDLPQAAQVRLEVFDINGRIVGATHASPLPQGEQSIAIDGSGLAAGVYVYRLTATPSGSGAGPTMAVGKLILLK